MSATGVASLDHTVHETNVWLRDVQEEIHLEARQDAYSALRAVLHTVRDRLPPEVGMIHLPLSIRELNDLGRQPTQKVSATCGGLGVTVPISVMTKPTY